MTTHPKTGRYRHYKLGDLYDVVGVARDISDSRISRELVVYRSVKRGVLWARALDEWLEPAIVDGQTVARYSPVSEEQAP
jgi:hypothetical protein